VKSILLRMRGCVILVIEVIVKATLIYA